MDHHIDERSALDTLRSRNARQFREAAKKLDTSEMMAINKLGYLTSRELAEGGLIYCKAAVRHFKADDIKSYAETALALKTLLKNKQDEEALHGSTDHVAPEIGAETVAKYMNACDSLLSKKTVNDYVRANCKARFLEAAAAFDEKAMLQAIYMDVMTPKDLDECHEDFRIARDSPLRIKDNVGDIFCSVAVFHYLREAKQRTPAFLERRL